MPRVKGMPPTTLPQYIPEQSLTSSVSNFEEIFDRTSHYGRYQLLMLVLIQYMMVNSTGNYVFISFASLKCASATSPDEEDICSAVAKCRLNSTVVFRSLYEELDFVCPNSQLPHHLQTLQAIGSGIGAILGGHLVDVYGRKWMSLGGVSLMTSFGLLGGLATTWHILAVAMFGMGLAYGIAVDATMTLASETVGAKHRIVQTLAFQWSLTIQVAALCAYLTGDWRRYLLAINLICLPMIGLISVWFVESPRWLIQRRRYTAAAESINRISQWNGSKCRFTADDLKQIDVDQGKRENESHVVYSAWHLISTRKLRGYTVVMFLSALTVEICIGVIIFDVQILAGNPFLNMALYGLLRLWVPPFILVMEANVSSCGRRSLFITSQSLTAVCYLLVLVFSSSSSTSNLLLLRTCLVFAGGLINSSIFYTVYKQFVIELYPTVMRGMALGTFGVVERLGGALAPQLINLNHVLWPGSALSVTLAVVFASLLAGLILLPETRNTAMPDVYIGKSSESEGK